MCTFVASRQVVDIRSRDIVLVRLPIAQGCHGKWYPLCNVTADGAETDPRNDFVELLGEAMQVTLSREFGDQVAVLPMSWTHAGSRKSGRHPCAVGLRVCACAYCWV